MVSLLVLQNDWKNLPGQYKQAGRLVRARFERLVTDGEKLLTSEYRKRKIGKSGRTENSIAAATKVKHSSRGIDAQIGSKLNDVEAEVILERGRKPGKLPPANAFKRWLNLAGIPADKSYIIRRAIARRGTKQWQRGGYKILSKSFGQVRNWLWPKMQLDISSILELKK